MDRNKKIITVSVMGILVNLLLVIFKSIIGLLVNSIAIILDAVNNLSDALSSVITIIGTKFAGKAPDKKHPYGYGRIEYISSVMIAIIVLLAGLTSFKESLQKVFHPHAADYTIPSLLIIAVTVVVKFVFGRYVKKTGQEINAQTLVASGTDSLLDAIVSFATIVAAVISMVWHVSLEGILGTIISVLIIKAGVEILMETLGSIIGARVDSELAMQLKTRINEFENVRGVYDLVLHNYGPNEMIGSVHIEVDDDMNAKAIHTLSRNITRDIYQNFGIVLTIGIYASNTKDGYYAQIKETIREEIGKYPEILQMHGFYVDTERKLITFDVIIDFKSEDIMRMKNAILEKLSSMYGDYDFDIILDNDYSD